MPSGNRGEVVGNGWGRSAVMVWKQFGSATRTLVILRRDCGIAIE
jgi:hypothetical protein